MGVDRTNLLLLRVAFVVAQWHADPGKVTEGEEIRAPLAALVSLCNLADWDPDVVGRLRRPMCAALPDAHEGLRQQLERGLHRCGEAGGPDIPNAQILREQRVRFSAFQRMAALVSDGLLTRSRIRDRNALRSSGQQCTSAGVLGGIPHHGERWGRR